VQLPVSIAIAWRSPELLLPPSMGAFNGTAYGPASLSSAYVNFAGYIGCDPGTTMYGIPIGAPLYSPDPKSAWTVFVAPIVLTRRLNLPLRAVDR
jgi:hypothetical protein